MWIIILLVTVNILIILFIIYVVGCSDSVPKFQIPNDEVSINMPPWDYYISLKHKSWNELTEL